MIVVALKALVEYLRINSAEGIATSIYLYATTLIVLPRMVRIAQKKNA
jgi:hypothetical protein